MDPRDPAPKSRKEADQAPLKLIVFDNEDLRVVSAHLQDAVVRVADLTYRLQDKRFVLVLNRFDWTHALANERTGARRQQLRRRQAALRFERVQGARLSGFDPRAENDVLSLLAVSFHAQDPNDPSGLLTLTFAGQAAIQLDVECLEAELRDLGPTWETRNRPRHPGGGGADPVDG